MAEKMTFHLSAFDGPLDLLLHLIAKNKVSIYDIPISHILEQYMQVLREAQSADMEVAGDFIAMAAQLMLIKSRMLLPKETHGEDEDDDPRAQLVEQLLEYQRIRAVQPFFRAHSDAGRDILVRPPEPLERKKTFEGTLPPERLPDAARRMLTRIGQRLPPPVSAFSGIVGRERVPVHTRITAILLRFRRTATVRFRSLFDDTHSRSEIVATFLAVLELSKTRRIYIDGEGDETEISLYAGGAEIREERIS
ncbi:MAG TPA: segregation/condensation protein A [Candidatus Butyricicoccus stercorigallinarum]|nr:segregation/condensation protein A [Candidatus Butyricicoccus stercorigallinarum]